MSLNMKSDGSSFWLSQIMSNETKKNVRLFFQDFFCGAGAGVISGAFVAIPEYLKVVKQTKPQFIIRKNLHRLLQQFPHILKSIPSFATIFSMTCAIQFSVNERIKKQIDPFTGILSSAITGSAFLTMADHLMYRNSHSSQTFKKALKDISLKRLSALWTGFTPMVFREIFFITSVMHLGPYIGKVLRDFNKDSQDPYMLYSSTGRLLTGILTTFISQPFDNIARRMQIILNKKNLQLGKVFQSKLMKNSKIESLTQKSFTLYGGDQFPELDLLHSEE